MMRRCATLLLLSTLVLAPSATGEGDGDAAIRAVDALRRSCRSRPALAVKTDLEFTVAQGGVESEPQKSVAEMVFVKDGPGRIRINDYTCWFDDGEFRAIHEKSDHAYYQTKYEGTPYWALWDVFRDLPYPHVALFWGEPEISDVMMQLHPKTPSVEPASIGKRTLEGVEFDVVMLEGPEGTLELIVDPRTRRLHAATHVVSGGPFVQPGSTVTSRYRFTYTEFDKAPADLAPPIADRQRVDLFAALAPREAAPAPRVVRGGGADEQAGPQPLVGRPAPGFVLATAHGDAIDLEDLRGKVIVLDFWATWCRPCRRALPMLHQVAAWADDKQLPVVVLTINTLEIGDPNRDSPDARLEAVRGFWAAQGLTLPVLMDYTDEVASSFGVQGIPATYVIRSDGVVHAQHAGAGADYADVIQADIEAALEAVTR